MSVVLILGLKISFKHLWVKIEERTTNVCACGDFVDNYTFCPDCGNKKIRRKIKVYKSRLTGEETTYRHINSVIGFLHENNLEVYDNTPNGYVDEPVYVYSISPLCFTEVPNRYSLFNGINFENIKSNMKDILGEDIWKKGEFGVWSIKKAPARKEDSYSTESENDDIHTIFKRLV